MNALTCIWPRQNYFIITVIPTYLVFAGLWLILTWPTFSSQNSLSFCFSANINSCLVTDMIMSEGSKRSPTKTLTDESGFPPLLQTNAEDSRVLLQECEFISSCLKDQCVGEMKAEQQCSSELEHPFPGSFFLFEVHWRDDCHQLRVHM